MNKLTPLLTDLTELHCHLWASSSAHLLREMAHNQGIRLDKKNYFDFIKKVKITDKIGFESYQTYFSTTHLIQSSPTAIEISVYKAISQAYREFNLTTLELRFNPMSRNKNWFYDLDNTIYAAIVGMKKAMMVYPIKVWLIIETDKRFETEKSIKIFEKAIKYNKEWIVGIDISWLSRDPFDIKWLADIFQKAKDTGLWTTVHTWEVTWPDEMWTILDKLNPDRIWHWFRCSEDPKLMKEIVKRNIVLELCPSSNLATKAILNRKDMANRFKILKKYNVPFTINTDGPISFMTNVGNEFKKLYEHGILSIEDIKKAKKHAKKASFIG